MSCLRDVRPRHSHPFASPRHLWTPHLSLHLHLSSSASNPIIPIPSHCKSFVFLSSHRSSLSTWIPLYQQHLLQLWTSSRFLTSHSLLRPAPRSSRPVRMSLTPHIGRSLDRSSVVVLAHHALKLFCHITVTTTQTHPIPTHYTVIPEADGFVAIALCLSTLTIVLISSVQ